MANFKPPANGASLGSCLVKNFVTDRQTDRFFDTIYVCVWIFLQVKFATSLLASLAGINKSKSAKLEVPTDVSSSTLSQGVSLKSHIFHGESSQKIGLQMLGPLSMMDNRTGCQTSSV